MKKIIIFLSIIISILCINKVPNQNDNMIRFRIIANSNSENDQNLKKKVLKEISNNIIDENIQNIEEERNFIKNNLSSIEDKIKNNTDDYTIKYGKNFFPEKKFNGIEYPAGEYESLVITLGEGSGDNFWCILFPPLCAIDNEDIEYKSLFKEVINKVF